MSGRGRNANKSERLSGEKRSRPTKTKTKSGAKKSKKTPVTAPAVTPAPFMSPFDMDDNELDNFDLAELVGVPEPEKVAKTRTPTDTELDAWLGPPVGQPPPQPLTEPTVVIDDAAASGVDLETLTERVRRATAAAQNKFYNEAHVASRYANTDAVRQFVDSSARVDTVERALQSVVAESSMRVDASLSRIDEAIAQANNNKALRRAIANNESVRGTTTITSALANNEQVVGIDQFVARVLSMRSADAVDQDLFLAPYQVEGLSERVPNPTYSQLQADRIALEARRADLLEERRAFVDQRSAIGQALLTNDRRKLDEARQTLNDYTPLESVKLLKPASEVRNINERWRTLLGQSLIRLNQQYEATTRQSLGDVFGDAVNDRDRDSLASLYMQRVVNSVFDDYVAQLRTATFEDMPLTEELLEQYFYKFLGQALESLLVERQAQSAAEREKRADAIAAQAGLAYDAGLVEAGRRRREEMAADDEDDEGSLFESARLGERQFDALSFEERERRTELEYMRQALFLYASPTLEVWFERWLAFVEKSVDENDDESVPLDVIATLRRSVKCLVEGRERDPAPRMRAWTEAAVAQQYASLVQNDIALQRTNQLLDNADNELLATSVELALVGGPAGVQAPEDVQLATELLVYPRIDRFDIVERARQRAINATTAALGRDNEDLGLRAALELIDARAAVVREQLLFYAPRTTGLSAHGPADGLSRDGNDDWTPFDLSYPLDIDTTRRQEPSIYSSVARLTERFDADTIHERADELRSVLSFQYAEQLVRREIMQIEYALRNLAQPTLDVPLSIERFVSDSRPLQFDFSIKLRDELALLAAAPSDSMVDAEVRAARDVLVTTEWTATLLFKPSYTDADSRRLAPKASERAIQTIALRAGQTAGRFTVAGVVGEGLGGLYRVVVNSATVDQSFESRFIAKVTIVAICKRDGKLYELGSQVHGDTEWIEPPRDKDRRDYVEELEVLVTRGPVAYQRLLDQRKTPRERLGGGKPLDANMYRPPWGTDDEQNLLHAWSTLDNSDFSFHKLIDGAAARLGEEVRQFLVSLTQSPLGATASDEVRGIYLTLRNLSGSLTPAQFFIVLVDRNGLRATLTDSSQSSALARAVAQVGIATRIAQGCYSDRTVGNGSQILGNDMPFSDLPLASVPNTPAAQTAFLQKLIDELDGLVEAPDELSEAERKMFDELPELFDERALPIEDILPVTHGTTQAISSLPLATVLRAFYTPVAWHMLTWRERRFIDIMRERFENFACDFRARERRSIYYRPLQENMPWTQHAPRPLDDEVPLFDRHAGDRNTPTPITVVTERKISRQLATLSAAGVRSKLGHGQYSIGDRYTDKPQRMEPFTMGGGELNLDREQRRAADTFMLDVELRAEFDSLVYTRLVVTGLLVVDQHILSGRNTHSGFAQPVALRRAPQPLTDGDGRLVTMSNRSVRQRWVGEHAYHSAQPDEYRLYKAADRGAYVVQRGSVPLGKGFDFDGIHEIIEAIAARYTRLVRTGEPGLDEGTRQRVLAFLDSQLDDLVLAYNYLAFVAVPFRGERVITGYELHQLIEADRDSLFARLRLLANAQTAALA